MPHKTNSMRMLEQRGIPYDVHEFSPDIHSAEQLAEALGVPAGQVYKTLVVLRDSGGPVLILVPGDRTLSLKLVAKSVGTKSLRMASQQEAERLTGLKVGGISALALLHRRFEVYADEAILSHPAIYVSSGRRGINLSLDPSDLLRVTNARTVRATRAENGAGT